MYGDVMSFIIYVTCSVPQGSVLGPLFFIVYMADLADLVAKYSESLHAYADDTQLYLHLCCNEIASSVDKLERCVLDIDHWMSANRLKLNARTAVRQLKSQLRDAESQVYTNTNTTVISIAPLLSDRWLITEVS